MKVLVVTPYLPHAGVGHGGGTAVRGLVSWLARRHEVLVASLVRPGEESLIGDVESLGVAVAPLPFLDREARGLDRLVLAGQRTGARLRSWLTRYPYYVEKYHTRDRARRLVGIAREFGPDAVQVEYLQMAPYCRDLMRWRSRDGGTRPRLVLNTHELGSIPRERHAARAAGGLDQAAARRDAAAWRRLQVDATGWADRTLCVTEEDRQELEAQGGRNLLTVPLGMDLEAIAGDWRPPGTERYLFVGSHSHRPNRLAADFLLDRVWPAVRKERPEAELVLAGRGFDDYLAGRADQPAGVSAPGFVPDLGPLFRSSRLFLAPLPEGGGIKIKILEAFAHGIPVVTTPVGAEGITTEADRACWITGCDEGFAAAVLNAARDEDEAAARGAAGRKLMEEKYSWASITDRLAEIYEGA